MKKYTTVLLGVAAIIGFIVLSATPAFAGSIHNALDNNLVVNETVETKTITSRHESTSQTIQDYVKNYLHGGSHKKRASGIWKQWSLFIQGNRVNL